MSCFIYCLYSTEDGIPRYVGRATSKVSFRFKQHITAALEKEPGVLYDWMREVWERGFDVAVHTLQEAIIPKDTDMFERYWIEQFANLLNVRGNKLQNTESDVGRQVREILRLQLTSMR